MSVSVKGHLYMQSKGECGREGKKRIQGDRQTGRQDVVSKGE